MAEPLPAPLRVLVIDDDTELCALMRDFLVQQGWTVVVVHDGRTGLEEAINGRFDAVTLDVMLPGLDGFEVLRQLRRRSGVPVLMLTARIATDDRIGGLEAGADDYLPKPFHPGELVARIRAVLRRTAASTSVPADVIDVGGVRLSASRRQVLCGDRVLQLTPAEFDILELLMQRAGLAVSRDELAARLYQRPASPYERGLDVHVSHLRRKLQSIGTDPIRTVRAIGYLFATD